MRHSKTDTSACGKQSDRNGAFPPIVLINCLIWRARLSIAGRVGWSKVPASVASPNHGVSRRNDIQLIANAARAMAMVAGASQSQTNGGQLPAARSFRLMTTSLEGLAVKDGNV